MFNLFKKSKLAGLLYLQVMAILGATAISCIAWFASVETNIQPDIPSSVLTSYFYCGTGTSTDPYVITKPVHYYNLVNLWENNYDGFDVDGGVYIQLGYKFDDTNYQFESYDDNGALIANTYSTYLNMNYYSDNRVLQPIGSGTHPFTGHVDGKGLTVENLYISGNGRCDIGIFGYVTADATITNVYYDNVIIDCSTPDLNDSTPDHVGSHPYNAYVGYLAGHTVDANSWSNVYVNDCKLVNSEQATVDKKNNYGYFGCVGEYEAHEPSSDINYNSTLRASDVYDYFNDDSHYSDISNKGLATRNTEYTVGDDDVFSDAVTTSDSTYTMVGDTSSTSQTKDYSLATVGYQSSSVTYDLTYGTNHLSLDAATIETTTSPEDQASTGSAGTYMYWDSSTNQWVYYITQMSQGGAIEVQYNCYFLSWDDVDVATNTITATYYLGNVDGVLTSTVFASGPTAAANPDYIWVLKDSSTSVGISSLVSNGGTRTVHFYSPENQTYLYCAEGGTASSPITPSFVTDYSASTAFTIDGPDSSIQFGGGVYSFINNGGVGGAIPNAIYRALPFHFTGGVTTTEEDENAKKYNLVTDATQFVADETYVFAYGTADGTVKAMSATQNTNNRIAIDAPVTSYQMSHVSDLGEFKLVGTSAGWSFLDVKNSDATTNKYLTTPTDSDNRMTLSTSITTSSQYTLTLDSNNQYIVRSVAYTDRFIAYNTREGTNGYLFSSYTLSSGSTEYIHFYVKDESSVDYITTAGAFQYSATTGASEDQLVSYAYDSYRSLPGTTDYTLFTIARADADLMVFDFPNSQVTITWPDETDGTWELVTNDTTLEAGDKLVITSASHNFAMSTTQNTNNRGQAEITKHTDPSTITFTESAGVCPFILGGTIGAWTFYDDNLDGYLYSASSSKNYLRTESTLTSDGQWAISISGSVASIVSQGSYTHNVMQYNVTSSLFACYSTASQINLSLYRWVAPTEYDGTPVYIGDNISEDYNPQYIDVVGQTTFSSTSFNISDYYSNIYSMAYYEDNEEMGIGTQFYNTFYISDAIVITIKKTGLLDLGTLVLSYTGGGTPMLTKGKDTALGTPNGLAVTGSTGFRCPDLDPSESGYQYSMSFSPHNILKACYCTLDASGNIYSSHDTSGNVLLCNDATFDDSQIDSYIIVITNSNSSADMNVTEVDFTFKTIPGNTGDFGTVGYRTATYVGGANSNSVSTQVTGTILNLYYEVDPLTGQQVYCKVVYDTYTQTYNVTFYSTVACELNVFNYDTSTYDLYVNGTQYYEGSNIIQIAATTYNSSTWVQDILFHFTLILRILIEFFFYIKRP